MPNLGRTCYYRSASGAEIDLLIRLNSRTLWAVEIKHGSVPKVPKGFSRTCAEVGATDKFIVYGGEEELSMRGGVTAISLPGLMRRLEDWQGDGAGKRT